MREYLIQLEKKTIAGTKTAAINFKEALATTRQCVKEISSIIDDNESLALLSVIDTELNRGEKDVSTIIETLNEMEADIDTASDINFMFISAIATLQMNKLNTAVENGLAVLNTLNAIKVNPDQ